MTLREERFLVRNMLGQPRQSAVSLRNEISDIKQSVISPETIRRALRCAGLNGRKKVKKPLLPNLQRKKRFNFALEYVKKD